MIRRLILVTFLLAIAFSLRDASAWGKGHTLIRSRAVEHLPEWQRELIGDLSPVSHSSRLSRVHSLLLDNY